MLYAAMQCCCLGLGLGSRLWPSGLFRAIFPQNPTRAAVVHFSLPRCPTITARTAKATMLLAFSWVIYTGDRELPRPSIFEAGRRKSSLGRRSGVNFAGSFRSAVELPDGFRTSAALATTLGCEAAQIQGSSPHVDRHVRPSAATSSLESFAHDILAQTRVP